ncbi:MAG: hypothetical protein K8U03_25715 [Planctomycetia bacterium]|nr:hypothetical protein [Planctomycetia bacterium]
MRRIGSSQHRTPLGRRIVGGIALAAYLVLCTGIPLPDVSHASSSNESPAAPFPCQSHRCGCRTAEQCWKSCCCMTDVEKRLWAERNGVVPPSYVAFVAGPIAAGDASSSGCCSKSSRSPKKTVVEKSDTKKKEATAASQPKSEVRWIGYLAAQRCSGGATAEWFNTPISLPAAEPLRCVAMHALVQPLVRLADPLWESAFSTPLRRPPRIV